MHLQNQRHHFSTVWNKINWNTVSYKYRIVRACRVWTSPIRLPPSAVERSITAALWQAWPSLTQSLPSVAMHFSFEIDFLLSRKAKVCPIEVKSSTSNVHVSIDEFQKKFSARILQRYLLHSKDIRKERDLIMLPMYMAMFL